MLLISLPFSHTVVITTLAIVALVAYVERALLKREVAKAEAAVRTETSKILQEAKTGIAMVIADVRKNNLGAEAISVVDKIEAEIKKLL